jgi:hypothetical protein
MPIIFTSNPPRALLFFFFGAVSRVLVVRLVCRHASRRCVANRSAALAIEIKR